MTKLTGVQPVGLLYQFLPLYGYEMKWNPAKQVKAPAAFVKAYPDAHFQVIHRENYWEWLGG